MHQYPILTENYGIERVNTLDFPLQECEHNPKKPVHCEQGCGLIIPKDELKVRLLNNGRLNLCKTSLNYVCSVVFLMQILCL